MSVQQFSTIGEAFLYTCENHPNKIAFRHKVDGKWKEFTYKDQFKAIHKLSLGLMELGLEKGDRASILAQTSLAWGRFDIAILGAGAITVPVYPTSNPEDTEYILNHSEVKIIFIDDFKNLQKVIGLAKNLSHLKSIVVNFSYPTKDIKSAIPIISWEEVMAKGEAQLKKNAERFENNLKQAKPDDTFTICYTSGTTGTPKGAILFHSCMCSVMEDCAIIMKKYVDHEEELLSFLPMSHIFGKWESMTPYFFGWTQSYAESIDALSTNLTEVRPTIWFAVPRIFEKAYAGVQKAVEEGGYSKKAIFSWALCIGRKYLERKNKNVSISPVLEFQYQLADRLVFKKIKNRFGGRLEFCISGSAPLARHIAEFMQVVGVPVYEGYGLTETCAPVSVNMPGENKFGTVGKLFPDVLVKIAEDGEILLKSKKVFHGYYKDEASTKAAFVDGWFATGDIGELDEDGYLKITDRKKDLIKTSGGKFIAPQKIEALLKTSPLINQVILYGDNKPYLTVLLTLYQEPIIQYARENKIIYSEFAELVKKPEIINLIQNSINEVNAKLGHWETIKKFLIIPQEFSVENGDMTPSLKLKRRLLTQKYKTQLESLYR